MSFRRQTGTFDFYSLLITCCGYFLANYKKKENLMATMVIWGVFVCPKDQLLVYKHDPFPMGISLNDPQFLFTGSTVDPRGPQWRVNSSSWLKTATSNCTQRKLTEEVNSVWGRRNDWRVKRGESPEDELVIRTSTCGADEPWNIKSASDIMQP